MCFRIDADDLLPAYQRWDSHPIRRHFEVLKELGSGSFSQVVLARHIETGKLAALKVVFMEGPNVDDETRIMLIKEGEILRSLTHPNLVKCSDVVVSSTAHVFVLEYLRGCSVLDGLHRLHHTYTEQDAAAIFKQLAEVVAYLHDEGVIHRDIKPENLQFVQLPETIGLLPERRHRKQTKKGNLSVLAEAAKVKLIDLGMAIYYDPHNMDKGALGSAGFVAPEIIKGKAHTPAMDIFSMGVLLFIMLVGRKPFNMSETENLKYGKMSLSQAPGLKDPRWLDLSPDAKDLLMRMLAYEPERRIKANEILKHDWVVTEGGHVPRILGTDVALGAAAVAEMRRLRFLCNGILALQRTATAASRIKNRRTKTKPIDFEDNSVRTFTKELKRIKRQETSVHGGNRSLRAFARAMTTKSIIAAHDSGIGGSVHSHNIYVAKEQSVREGSAYLASYGAIGPKGLRDDASTGVTGMKRSSTAVFLSELTSSQDKSIHGSVVPVYKDRNDGSVSSLKILGSSMQHLLDVSVHGGRSSKSATEHAEVSFKTGSSNKSEGDCFSSITSSPSVSGSELTRIVTVMKASEDNQYCNNLRDLSPATISTRRSVRSFKPL